MIKLFWWFDIFCLKKVTTYHNKLYSIFLFLLILFFLHNPYNLIVLYLLLLSYFPVYIWWLNNQHYRRPQIEVPDFFTFVEQDFVFDYNPADIQRPHQHHCQVAFFPLAVQYQSRVLLVYFGFIL